MSFKILALGDVVGDVGTSFVCRRGFLSGLKKKYGADFVIANGENSAKGNGLSVDSAAALFDAGVDVITGGNHTWQKSGVYTMLDDERRLVRPANFPGAAPGHGYSVIDAGGVRILVMNALGNAFMTENVASAFECVDRILAAEEGNFDLSVLDFHAETTSEKIAMGHYLDGRVTAVFGTHTHVQTADAKVLPGGTGYITDLGMCGSMAGVLGVKTECIIHKFTVHTPVRFEEAQGDEELHGALFTVDDATGRCTAVEAICER